MQMEAVLRAMGQKIAEAGALTDAKMKELNESFMRPGQPPKFEPRTPAERAQALCYQALDARGRRQVQLARQALGIDPDCCEALLMLAERAGAGGDDAEGALPLYRRAVEAGQRQLGPEAFETGAGQFWGIVETRPYMRARAALGVALMNLDRFDEAASHFTDMLRLNPGDNQGVRYHLAQCLLLGGKLDELEELLNRSTYHDDFSAEWAFTKALLAYRREGASSPAAQARLDEAQRSNPFVAPLLIGRVDMPPVLPETFQPGDESEAVTCAEAIAPGWHDTPGALEWLDTTLARQRRAAKKETKKQVQRKNPPKRK
jgi:tetratricopeptide (TPR) repeat protein